ncbi:MAG: hypothetical protein U0166_12915 [Acidobacteriota bacterium]
MSREAIQILRIARRIVPEAATLDAEGERRFLALVDEALTSRTPAMRRQLGLFLGVMRVAAFLRFGGSLEKIPAAKSDALLRFFQESPLRLLRMGFWGVKTLAFLGYYGRREIGPSIGYTPSRDGNALLGTR